MTVSAGIGQAFIVLAAVRVLPVLHVFAVPLASVAPLIVSKSPAARLRPVCGVPLLLIGAAAASPSAALCGPLLRL